MNINEVRKKLKEEKKGWKRYNKQYPKRNWIDEKLKKEFNIPNITNEEKSFFEVQDFKKHKYPKYSAYLSNEDYPSKITTWTGEPIGEILHKQETRRKGFTGDKVFSVTAKGINDVIYKGYGSRGAIINLKKKLRNKGVKF